MLEICRENLGLDCLSYHMSSFSEGYPVLEDYANNKGGYLFNEVIKQSKKPDPLFYIKNGVTYTYFGYCEINGVSQENQTDIKILIGIPLSNFIKVRKDEFKRLIRKVRENKFSNAYEKYVSFDKYRSLTRKVQSFEEAMYYGGSFK